MKYVKKLVWLEEDEAYRITVFLSANRFPVYRLQHNQNPNSFALVRYQNEKYDIDASLIFSKLLTKYVTQVHTLISDLDQIVLYCVSDV